MHSAYVVIMIALGYLCVFAQNKQTPPASPPGLSSMLPMLIIMFAVVYFLMIRPQQKKQKEIKKMLDEIKKGDKIITIGGIFGVVSNVKDHSVMVKVSDNNTIIEIRKTAIQEVIKEKQEKAESEEKK